jgi:rare lipoprotein A
LRSRSATRARPRHAALGALALGSSLSLAVTTLAAAAAPAQAPTPVAAAPVVVTDRPTHHRRLPAELHVRRRTREVRAGGAAQVAGTLLPRRRGRAIVVEAVAAGGRWHPVAHGRTRANGHFRVRVPAPRAGTIRLRVRFRGDRRAHAARARAGTLRAFRPGLASWYALYGGALACGGTLGYGTLGVANKTLPCGTKVTLRYRNREVTVRVIDRGPYAGGREWDLTGATARRLGFDGVGVVWSTR